jgi:ATP-dependent helicase Lhr and Lhr-like helicase
LRCCSARSCEQKSGKAKEFQSLLTHTRVAAIEREVEAGAFSKRQYGLVSSRPITLYIYPTGHILPQAMACAAACPSKHQDRFLDITPPATLSGLFHPAVASWFHQEFGAPTPAQAEAWPSIQAGRHTLVAAPTGSGKTLAAFLAAIDSLVRQGLEAKLPDETQIVYVSPLKALSNDIERNLQAPLAGIKAALAALGMKDVDIRTWVRTGDTPAAEREKMRRRPPHIVVTTPESLYILLGSESGRAMLRTTRTVIVDEIHALAPNKRGAHLALSLERLGALCKRPLLRVGLSATQKPIELMAHFLTGATPDESLDCSIIDTGHARDRDIALEVPSSPLEAVMSAEVWTQLYDRMVELAGAHRTTLVFVNTRRMAERVAGQLSDRLGEGLVMAHHGSMAREHRLDAEQRLKRGELKILVATASLELGIDIGDVDLVCQLGSPRSIASFLQRVGRSGHSVGGTPKGRLFPLSRDELVECAALVDSVRRGELDRLIIPAQPLDVLAQQIVAEAAAQEWHEDELLTLFRRAWPYRSLPREVFAEIVRMLAEGFTTRRGRRGALLHHDAVNHMLRGRRGARLTALTSGGTIPDTADYQVVLEPENQSIGSVNEDFAVESMAGDIFQLGNTAYRIIRVERGIVRVEDARGLSPTIPFWLGEAPGRSAELSLSVSRLRQDIEVRLQKGADEERIADWLAQERHVAFPAAEQLAEYLGGAHTALGCLPTQETIVLERFFDEAGGMQLVIHSPYGSRINRAWGLALRKRFCRKFNFELQAAATEDNIVLSLTTAHSFELGDAAHYLHSASVRTVLIQALLDAPMFTTRWRWVAGTALALPRRRGGKKIPPQLARMEAEDLIANVFPDQLACAENLVGAREIPGHPLVNQTLADCLDEAMDIAGLERLLGRLEGGEIRVVSLDLTQPSPLALEILNARPYAFLDDAPLEERRTQAVMNRRWLSPEQASDIGRLDPEAIVRVRNEAWPDPVNADELHDALAWIGFLAETELAAQPEWRPWLAALARQGRVSRLRHAGIDIWIATERLGQFRALWPEAQLTPLITVPDAYAGQEWSAETACVEILRGRLEGLGPVTRARLAAPLSCEASLMDAALVALEVEGFALRGHFTPGAAEEEWCVRGLLARIHNYTIKRLRAEIEPVAARDFLRFLFTWQHVSVEARMEGPDAIGAALMQLEGFEAPAGAWESEILPARLTDYEPAWLDDECLAGRTTWARLKPRPARIGTARGASPVRATPVTLLPRRHATFWQSLLPEAEAAQPSVRAQAVMEVLREHGASFFDEIITCAGLLRQQVEEALGELVALGLVTSDSFGGLRALLAPSEQRSSPRHRRRAADGMERAGRWSLTRKSAPASSGAIEHVAHSLLLRYGIVFWRMLEREADWLPPWRDLLRVYRRMEARGEIRGGRFVAGFSGEQFALPDAIGLLREIKRKQGAGDWVSLSGADPLNLAGILTPGPKLPALTGNRILYRDGLPVASLAGTETFFYESMAPAEEWQARKRLLRGIHAPVLHDTASTISHPGIV